MLHSRAATARTGVQLDRANSATHRAPSCLQQLLVLRGEVRLCQMLRGQGRGGCVRLKLGFWLLRMLLLLPCLGQILRGSSGEQGPGKLVELG